MKERWNGFTCGFNYSCSSDTIAAENTKTVYVFELDITQFSKLGDGVMSDLGWDDELH
jgi:hypothetical protein